MRSLSLFLLLAIFLLAGCETKSNRKLSNLKAELTPNQLGLSLDEIQFSWSQDTSIESFRILAASDRTLIEKGVGDLWDSGRRYSRESSTIYQGRPLIRSGKFFWQVQVWNAEGSDPVPSAVQTFRAVKYQRENVIALVGGNLISSMERHPHFEEALIRRWPYRQIIVRNLGWPADDVFGLARSQFGSAQNTRSWQPPTAEEGFGSKVLGQHLKQVMPATLFIGYGTEGAFFEEEADFELFESGYRRLIKHADSLGCHSILLSPPKQEAKYISPETVEKYNANLRRVRDMIRSMAVEGNHPFIDLFEYLITDPTKPRFTTDGLQLNAEGHKRLAEQLIEDLGLYVNTSSQIVLRPDGSPVSVKNGKVTNWHKTVHGFRFDFTPNSLSPQLTIKGDFPHVIFFDDDERMRAEDSTTIILDSKGDQIANLRSAILEKNRLYRWILQPLNEAYIFLFRRHEMGHLAYELEDYERLVEEKEEEITRLISPPQHTFRIELIKSWQSPRDYPEDEVPANIPEPNLAEELKAFEVANGFEVNLFASDPMIANPINLNWDTRGRAWVATSSTYPHIEPGREPSDRIIILEDWDDDGMADTSIVFAEDLMVPHSVMPVPGGAYVTSTTEFLFLSDTNGDDRADLRQVVHDGFGNADVHHMIHGLRWAPWGNLYFTQSIYINTFIETVFGPRQLNGSGIWRFRPETGRLDVFSSGLINPWGHALDEWGQAFATDGAGSSGINYIFPGSAHATAVGAARVLEGLNSGTPKNTAAEVVYSRHFPQDWQGSIITNDFRANRTVRYELSPSGSGYDAKEVQTVLKSDHRSYRPVDTKIGPDGALYIVDWYNPIIDHGEVDFHHPIRDKTHGRIWRLTNKHRAVLEKTDMTKRSMPALLELLRSPEPYNRQQANRELVARGCEPSTLNRWARSLDPRAASFERDRLEALWLGAAINYYDADLHQAVLKSQDARARAAAVRMIRLWKLTEARLDQLSDLVYDEHPQVRLEAIHALREFPSLQTAKVVMETRQHPVDDNLDYAIWLTMRAMKDHWLPALREGVPIFSGSVNDEVYALLACGNSDVVPLLKQRINDPDLAHDLQAEALRLLARLGDSDALDIVLNHVRRTQDDDLLRSIARAPASNVAVPSDKSLIADLLQSDSIMLQIIAAQLAGRWKAVEYLPQLQSLAQDFQKDQNVRLTAGRALVKMDRLRWVENLARSAKELPVRSTAAAVWAESDASQASGAVMKLLSSSLDDDDAELLFRTYRNQEKGPAILAEVLKNKKIPEAVASIGLRVTQTSGLNLADLESAIREAGELAPVGVQLSTEEKTLLIEDALTNGNRYYGSQIYRRPQLLCATCHQINGIGGLLGPDLTTVGSYMTPGSILESLINPNTDIKQGYETVIATRKDGSVISGTLHRKGDQVTMIRMANNELISIPDVDLETMDVSEVSLMPASLTASLHRDELRDLLYFLASLEEEN